MVSRPLNRQSMKTSDSRAGDHNKVTQRVMER